MCIRDRTETDRQTDRQTDRDRDTGRQTETDRQRHTHRETDRQTEERVEGGRWEADTPIEDTEKNKKQTIYSRYKCYLFCLQP